MGNTCETDIHVMKSEIKPRISVISKSSRMNRTQLLFLPKNNIDEFNLMSFDIMPYEAHIFVDDPKPSLVISTNTEISSDDIPTQPRIIEKSYQGPRYKNKWHGRGVLVTIDDYTFDGEFDAGEACGFGTLKTPDGSVIKGYWQKGRLEGEGSEIWADGTSYEGEYKNGYKEGSGVFKWGPNHYYKGTWKNDLQDGSVG